MRKTRKSGKGGRKRPTGSRRKADAGKPQILDVAIDLEVRVRVPPERIYDALATAQGLDAWFTTGTTMEPRPGGAMVWRWKDWALTKGETSARAEVLESRPPERYAFRWEAADDLWTDVRMGFQRIPEGTLVRLRETGFPDTPRGRRVIVRTAGRRGEALVLAKFYVEHGVRY